jgi:hypothetical protein
LGFLRYFGFVKRFIPSYVFDGQNYAKTGHSQPLIVPLYHYNDFLLLLLLLFWLSVWPFGRTRTVHSHSQCS